MDCLHDYHNCQKELNKDQVNEAKYHENEAQRRLLQFEEFQTKRIEIEGKLFSEIAKYYSHVGNDTFLIKLLNIFEDWEHPKFTSKFVQLNNTKECEKKYEECDRKIDSIDEMFKKQRDHCLIRIQKKLKI